ncbi:hypothetical protein PMm318_A07190 [Pseudomonas moorei]
MRAFKQRALAVEVFGTTGSKACGEIERHAGLGDQVSEAIAVPCGSGLARDGLEDAAGYQMSRVIVDDHRDGATIRQARSYRVCIPAMEQAP